VVGVVGVLLKMMMMMMMTTKRVTIVLDRTDDYGNGF